MSEAEAREIAEAEAQAVYETTGEVLSRSEVYAIAHSLWREADF